MEISCDTCEFQRHGGCALIKNQDHVLPDCAYYSSSKGGRQPLFCHLASSLEAMAAAFVTETAPGMFICRLKPETSYSSYTMALEAARIRLLTGVEE